MNEENSKPRSGTSKELRVAMKGMLLPVWWDTTTVFLLRLLLFHGRRSQQNHKQSQGVSKPRHDVHGPDQSNHLKVKRCNQSAEAQQQGDERMFETNHRGDEESEMPINNAHAAPTHRVVVAVRDSVIVPRLPFRYETKNSKADGKRDEDKQILLV